jgi:hypothetical protein
MLEVIQGCEMGDMIAAVVQNVRVQDTGNALPCFRRSCILGHDEAQARVLFPHATGVSIRAIIVHVPQTSAQPQHFIW